MKNRLMAWMGIMAIVFLGSVTFAGTETEKTEWKCKATNTRPAIKEFEIQITKRTRETRNSKSVKLSGKGSFVPGHLGTEIGKDDSLLIRSGGPYGTTLLVQTDFLDSNANETADLNLILSFRPGDGKSGALLVWDFDGITNLVNPDQFKCETREIQ